MDVHVLLQSSSPRGAEAPRSCCIINQSWMEERGEEEEGGGVRRGGREKERGEEEESSDLHVFYQQNTSDHLLPPSPSLSLSLCLSLFLSLCLRLSLCPSVSVWKPGHVRSTRSSRLLVLLQPSPDVLFMRLQQPVCSFIYTFLFILFKFLLRLFILSPSFFLQQHHHQSGHLKNEKKNLFFFFRPNKRKFQLFQLAAS